MTDKILTPEQVSRLRYILKAGAIWSIDVSVQILDTIETLREQLADAQAHQAYDALLAAAQRALTMMPMDMPETRQLSKAITLAEKKVEANNVGALN